MPVGDDGLIARLAGQFAGSAPKVIGVAVSGGGDSMALLHLMHRASDLAGWRIEVVTVDHRLRTAAAAEARMVAGFCAGIGVPHTTLVWEHGDITGNLMDQARRARAALIAGWAAQRGIGTVVLGHTADDQAETLLMELGRAAGLDGMAGMRADWQDQGIRWCRPLLRQTRASLRRTLDAQGISWVDDPTNDDPAYTRVKARWAMQALAPLGITVERLARVAEHLSSSRSSLVWALGQASARLVQEQAGALSIDRRGFEALPNDMQRRLLIAALLWLSGREQVPRGQKVNAMFMALMLGKDASLAGCRARVFADRLLLLREPRAVAAVTCPVAELWDGHWQVEPPDTGADTAGLQLRALGSEGLRQTPGWRTTSLPRDVLLVTPGVWQGDRLIAAPLAGEPAGWKARIVVGFQTFLVSH